MQTNNRFPDSGEGLGLVERLREMSRRGYWPLLGDEAADEMCDAGQALKTPQPAERCKCGYPMPCGLTVPVQFCRA